jgi:ribosome-associated protein
MTENTKDIVLRDALEKSLDADKAEDIVIIDLRGKVAYADWMIVATGLNSRHLQSMAQKCEDRMKELGYKGARFEGMTDGNWVIVDAEDVIIHLFRPAVRQFYKIEDLWQVGPTRPAPAAAE